MLYYVVGLLDIDSYNYIEEIQKSLSKKYHLYTDLPTLHVTLEVIESPDNINNLCTIVESILAEFKSFSVQIDGAICFNPPFKSVNLKIQNKDTIRRLVYKLNYTLKQNGFSVRENISDWDLHISLANTNFSLRKWTEEEYNEACIFVTENNYKILSKINKVEIWKPINDKDKMVISSFSLK